MTPRLHVAATPSAFAGRTRAAASAGRIGACVSASAGMDDAVSTDDGAAVSRRGSWRLRGDDGSAVVEFVTLGLLLLLPLIYLVLATGRVQAAGFAADSSARAAARAFVLAASDEEAHGRARAAVRLGLRDQGFDAERSGRLEVECSADPCLTPGARVVATVTVDVVLPGVPAAVDGVVPVHVTVRSTQVASVGQFRAPP